MLVKGKSYWLISSALFDFLQAEDEVPLKKRPIKDDLIVYRRGVLSAKKRRMASENQPNTSSDIQLQNETLGDFLASRLGSLRNNQKKRGRTTGTRSGKLFD